MAENLKNLFFTDEFIQDLGTAIKDVYAGFNQSKFNRLIYSGDWKNKELKQKMHHVSQCLKASLPEDFPRALKILTEVAPSFQGFNSMVFPDFVEKYGQDHWELSLPALAFFTRFCSSEFAIRPFLQRDPDSAMRFVNKWAEDDDYHIRRLASEGCRPRLPWAMSLPAFKKDPALIFPVLEKLKNDPEEYVRKSVANNLNDISKDHPDKVLDICERWYGHGKNTDWIVKRACRTMLKQGNKRALLLFGFVDPGKIEVENLEFDRQSLPIGDELEFSFRIKLTEKKVSRIRLEYGVDFIKARGKISRKIFQIKEAELGAGKYTITRKHSFRNLSTRKHYPGQHKFTIIVNGIETTRETVELI